MDTKKIQKVIFIFTVWTLLYFMWYRWVMLYNWDFNIFAIEHWRTAFDEWWNKGWIIQGSWWIYVILLFLMFPLWILGFFSLISIKYEKTFERLFEPLIYQNKAKKNQQNTSKVRVKRKKSYMEIRPRALAGTPQKVANVKKSDESNDFTASQTQNNDLFMDDNTSKSMQQNMTYSRREVTDDFEGESPFETPAMHEFLEKEQPKELKENIPEIMTDAGATVVTKPSIDGNSIDYLALSEDKVFLVLTDSEEGDWLADEERFNDEDPLWFSETSHRISPITALKKFETILKEKLSDEKLEIQTQIILVKTNGNIINAEDMLSTWEQMNASVARSSFGLPEELPSFAEVFPKELKKPDNETIEKVESIVSE